MKIIYAAILAIILDILLGDPEWLIHPVVIMGGFISRTETLLREFFPKTRHGEYTAGLILAISLPVLTIAFTLTPVILLDRYAPKAAFVLQVFWCWQSLAMKGLLSEGRAVADALDRGETELARQSVSRIVGRDTESLDEKGIIRACIESLAENFSDGVFAPLFYFFIGGAPLALCYKAVNTMDSMVGYRNERYIYFGRAAARLDDAANIIPSRLAAWILIISSGFLGYDAKGALRIWKRDRRKHDSPNSAQTESVVAGALGIELGGGSYYFGKYKDKPVIGDSNKEPDSIDIRRSIKMVFLGTLVSLVLLCLAVSVIHL